MVLLVLKSVKCVYWTAKHVRANWHEIQYQKINIATIAKSTKCFVFDLKEKTKIQNEV